MVQQRWLNSSRGEIVWTLHRDWLHRPLTSSSRLPTEGIIIIQFLVVNFTCQQSSPARSSSLHSDRRPLRSAAGPGCRPGRWSWRHPAACWPAGLDPPCHGFPWCLQTGGLRISEWKWRERDRERRGMWRCYICPGYRGACWCRLVKSSSRALPRTKRGSYRLWKQRRERERDAEKRDMNRQEQTIAQLLTTATITSLSLSLSSSLALSPSLIQTHTHIKRAARSIYFQGHLVSGAS